MTANRGSVLNDRQVRSGSWAAWMVAIRPHSLLVAFSPVLVGATLGFARAGDIDLIAALLVLGAALLVQVITNMQNDVGYTVRGAERSGTRTGLPRATANGWLSVRHVRAGIVVVALVATALGLALVLVRGWPVLLPALLLPSALQLRRDFQRCAPGLAFNTILFRSFRLELWFAALLSAAALLGKVLA